MIRTKPHDLLIPSSSDCLLRCDFVHAGSIVGCFVDALKLERTERETTDTDRERGHERERGVSRCP